MEKDLSGHFSWCPSLLVCLSLALCVLEAQAGKSPISPYTGLKRPEFFLSHLIVMPSILCGPVCATVLSGEMYFTCALSEFFILLSQSVHQVLLLFPKLLLAFLISVSPAQEHLEGQ